MDAETDDIIAKERTPSNKYDQLVNFIVDRILSGELIEGASLPSINRLSYQLGVSRDTVEKGYKKLIDMGFIYPIKRRGYFVRATNTENKVRVQVITSDRDILGVKYVKTFLQHLNDGPSVAFLVCDDDEAVSKNLFHASESYDYRVFITSSRKHV